jgi:hypothetical protein
MGPGTGPPPGPFFPAPDTMVEWGYWEIMVGWAWPTTFFTTSSHWREGVRGVVGAAREPPLLITPTLTFPPQGGGNSPGSTGFPACAGAREAPVPPAAGGEARRFNGAQGAPYMVGRAHPTFLLSFLWPFPLLTLSPFPLPYIGGG